MRSNTTFFQRLTTILMLIAAAVAVAAIGAWQSISPAPTAAVEQRSAFVQSGGVTTDADPSLPEANQALSHARAPSQPEVDATTF
jgi:hypothetical protein